MFKSILTGFILPLLMLFGSRADASPAGINQQSPGIKTETIEKLIAINGGVTVEVDLDQLNDPGTSKEKRNTETLRFALAPDSFFTIVVANNALRGPLPGSMELIPQNAANLPASFSASFRQIVLEKTRSDDAFDLAIRDKKSGFVFFNIEGHHYDYDHGTSLFAIKEGRLLISKEFAKQLGRPLEARAVGTISLTASVSPIEIRTLVDGEVQSAAMPPLRIRANGGTQSAPGATTLVAGPDVIVGEVISVEQPANGTNGSFVGLGVGTTACNAGDQQFHWFATPDNDHPVIPQNLYRMSGGTSNNERFEQIGQSWLKHSFAANEEEAPCNFGCNTTGCTINTNLCPGCTDAYSANLNYSQSGLGSRAWVNPFTGSFPRGDSTTPPNNHVGHTHTPTSHRITVAISDLSTTLNTGATYFGEAQYVSPNEYTWCQAHPGQCNMYNNVSYRQFSVVGTASPFTFPPVGSTVRTQPAIMAWTGATLNQIEPAPGADGIGFVGCKVTNPSAGVWHYDYAVYNENLDRAIQSFSVPLGLGMNVSNIGFHAPPQDPAWANDGTVGNAGYSSAAWTSTQTSSSLTWNSETFAQNQNANAIRWGTLYNFRFDSDRPPQSANATMGFFKTGAPITVGIQVPSPGPTPTPTPFGATPTPSPTPTATPTPTPTPTPGSIAMVSLPVAGIGLSVTDFTQAVGTSTISGANNFTGFQGDITFDSTVVTFQSPPVSKAGLTGGNWNVTGNVLSGPGPIRTLHITASSNDLTPLSGSGTLFNLNMTRVSSTPGASTALTWAAPPDNFYFIDASLNPHAPDSAPPGSVTIQGVIVSGTITYCSNPAPGPVAGVTLTLTGTSGGSTLSDGSGNYQLSSLSSGGSYTVTPSKAALPPVSTGINTVDLIGVQRHFLVLGTPLTGCRLTAADVNGDSNINTVDVVAIQRFFLGMSTGTANVGKYRFTPASRTYPGVVTDQTGQNYDTLVFGDVAFPYADRAGGPSPDGGE